MATSFRSLATLASWRPWRNRRLAAVPVILLLLIARPAAGGWVDEGWTYRRTIEVERVPGKAVVGELAIVESYTAGHQLPNGADVRVATGDGREIPSRVLQVGPGDFVRVAFTLQKKQKNYLAYFGNP